MNKRIKEKTGIIKKKCDDSCDLYKLYTKMNLITHNGCGSCKFREEFEVKIKEYWENKNN